MSIWDKREELRQKNMQKKRIFVLLLIGALFVAMFVVAVKENHKFKLDMGSEVTETMTAETETLVTESQVSEVETESETEPVSEASEVASEAPVEEPVNTDPYANYVPPLTWEKRANSGSGFSVCIDPGHQRYADSNKEPNGPGSDVMKARVTGGATGQYTGVPEYELNLAIGMKLKEELESRGYTVYMTRESHDVNISNKERAEYATSVNADITIRIHADSLDDTSARGAHTIVPSAANPYVSAVSAESAKLGQYVIDYYCSETGINNRGVRTSDTMTGINWCTMPVTILEMGFMSNYDDDTMMQNIDVQKRMVTGIANGIDRYFSEW